LVFPSRGTVYHGRPQQQADLILLCELATGQVAALSAELAHLRSNSRDPRSRTWNRRSGSRPPSRDDAKPTLCWYHRRYGAQEQKCTQPCSYRQQEKSTQRISAASHVCAKTTSRLFITDRLSKRQFLFDTGSDLSVYPAGSFRDTKYATATTSARLTALPSPLRMAAPQHQPRTTPEFQMEIRDSRRHTSTHRRRLPFSFQPPSLYVLYNDNTYLYRRLIRGCLFTHRRNSHRWQTSSHTGDSV
jgi:hypothetical protein